MHQAEQVKCMKCRYTHILPYTLNLILANTAGFWATFFTATVVSRVGHKRGGWMGGVEWVVERLGSWISSVRTVWVQEVPAIGTNMPIESLREVSLPLGPFQTHAFYLVSFMSPVVAVMNLHGWQTRSRKADQSAKPGNVTVNG